MDGWSVKQQMIVQVYKDRLLQKSSNRKSKLVLSTLDSRWSLHGFQTSHFICDQFGYKLWLQSTQNHARHRFQLPSFCMPPSEVAVLFNSNLSRRRFLGQVALHLQPIWLQTLVAIYSESYQTLFPSFCAPPSEVAVMFRSNLSRRPFLGQFVNLDLLLCAGFDSEHAV